MTIQVIQDVTDYPELPRFLIQIVHKIGHRKFDARQRAIDLET